MVSTLVGLKRFLAGVTRRPDRLKSLSLLLLATGTAMTTLVRWASRGSCSWCTLHQESRSAAVVGGGQHLVHQALLLEVVQGGGVPWHTGLTPTRKSNRDSCWQFDFQASTGVHWLRNHVKVMGEREILNKSYKFS